MQDQFNMKKDADVVVQNEQQECQTTKQKSKTPTHLTIQQQNQNNKIKLNPNAKQARKSSRSPQQKTFKKLYKQQKKVRSLEQEYRQLQEEVREIKQLVKLQLQLIQHNSKNFDSQIQVENKSSQEKSKVTLPSESQQKKPLQKLQHCIGQLFSYHSTIETVNSNYLLLSQVNKEEESQHIFHINNLQERVRQLRFLLNGKQDLLAYELATFDKNTPNDQFIGEEPQKILIDYHMPKKDSLNSKNNMESEFKFVQKVIKEMTKLKQTVNKLEKQVQSYNICQPKNSMDNEEGESQIEPKKTFDRDYVIEKDENNQVNYAYTSRTSRNQNINQNSNTKNSTPVKPFAEHNLNTVNSPKQMKTSLKSAVSQFLPLGNYKQSLIYRVGKLHQIQQQRSRQLKKTYQELLKQSQAQSLLKKTLVSDYEIKRDIYTYKKNQRAHQQTFYILKDLQKQITQAKSDQILKQGIIEENIELKASKIQQLNVQPQQLQMTSNRFETSQGFKTVNSFKDQNLDHSPSKSINVFKQRIHNIISHQNQNSDQKTTQIAKIQPEQSQHNQEKSLKTQQNQNSQNENFEKVNGDQMNDRTNVNEEVILIDSQTTQNAPCVSLQSVPQNRVFENITNNQKHSKSKSIHNPFLKLKILTDEETLKRKHFSHEQNFNRFQQKLIEKKISSESRPHFKGNKQNEGFSQQNNEVQQEKHEQAQIPQRQLNFESQTQPQAQNQNICNPYRKAISRRRKEKTIKQSQQKKQTIIQTVET